MKFAYSSLALSMLLASLRRVSLQQCLNSSTRCYTPLYMKEIKRFASQTGLLPKLSTDAINTMKDLGITKTHRSCRSGIKVKLRRMKNQNLHIPVRITQLERKTIKRIPSHSTINRDNLLVIDRPVSLPVSANAKIKFSLWNAQSINKKSALVTDIILSNRLDMFAITETWIKANENNSSVTQILHALNDFSVIQIPRITSKGGGLALFYRKAFTITAMPGPSFQSFEHIDLSITYEKLNFQMVLIYRPPPSTKNKLTIPMFFDDFHKLLDTLDD